LLTFNTLKKQVVNSKNMKTALNEKIRSLTCEKSYYIPNTNIKIEEHNPMELEKLWANIENLSSF
jgi:low affinity Fe/Cu permease